MTDALHTLVGQVRDRLGDVPVDALACSLGCEFLARAAVERPDLWGRLAFVSPTGLSGTKARRDAPGTTAAKPWLHALLSAPLWSGALYGALTRPSVVRFFLEKTWGSKEIDEVLWAYDVRTARYPGARFAPLHFLAGSLFSRDIHTIYEALTQRVWMSHGVRGDFSDFQALPQLRIRDSWVRTSFQAGALPYFEVPDQFFAAMSSFFDVERAEALFAI
jgi:pimeloyl-ACP methyl ester carboxylesterase